MSVSPFSLVSLDDVKSFLSITDTDKDSWLENEIDKVSLHIERYLDRNVIARQYKKDYDGTDSSILYVDNSPILQVDALYQSVYQEFNDNTLIRPSEYRFDTDNIELVYSSFYYGVRSVRVDYSAGYGDIEIPQDRTRIDFRETSSGDLHTVHLLFGKYTPSEIAIYLETEMNDVGDYDRTVEFDYNTYKFTIRQQDEDGLVLVPSDASGSITESESGFPLLGYTGTGHTSSPAVSSKVNLEIPIDLKGAVIDLIVNRYDVHYKSSRRGISSERTGDYQVSYVGSNMNNQLMMSEDVKEVLNRYRLPTYF